MKDLGNDTAAIYYMRQAIGLRKSHIYLTTLGTLLPDKDVDAQIAAYDEALTVTPTAMLAFCLRAERYAITARWDELERDAVDLVELQQLSLMNETQKKKKT